MATADLTVIGLGRASASASEYIAEMQRRLQAQDKVRFKLHAMGTELEGRVEDILEVVRQLHNVPFEAGLPRVYTVLKLDERMDKPMQRHDDKVKTGGEQQDRVSTSFRRNRSIIGACSTPASISAATPHACLSPMSTTTPSGAI